MDANAVELERLSETEALCDELLEALEALFEIMCNNCDETYGCPPNGCDGCPEYKQAEAAITKAKELKEK